MTGAAPGAARADALRARLVALGVRAEVLDEGAVAVVRPAAWPAGGLAPLRRAVVEAARAAGFTHAAVELTDALLDGAAAAAAAADAGDGTCGSSSR